MFAFRNNVYNKHEWLIRNQNNYALILAGVLSGHVLRFKLCV